MRVLVTGGTGFIGSNLAQKLMALNNEVIITGTKTENQVPGAKLLESHLTGINWGVLGKIDMVFHQAANNDTTDRNADEMFQANCVAGRRLFEELYGRGCRKFVYASSTATYGAEPAPYVEGKTAQKPLNEYGESKEKFERMAEDFAKHNDVETCVGLRYSNVYGPGEQHKGSRASMIYKLYLQMVKGAAPILFRDGTQLRDWCYVEDVVSANMLAGQFKGCEIFNVGSGRAVSFNRLVQALNVELGTTFEPIYIENPYKEWYQAHTECDVNKARRLLSWTPQYGVQTGIAEMVRRLGQ
jgi:ADP-L-glycero-D-manno-heptose 6-epimerase